MELSNAARSGGARVAYGSTSQTSGVSVEISVNGSLDEQEVADISELLQQAFRKRSDFQMLRFLRIRPSRWTEVKQMLRRGVPIVDKS